PPAELVFDSQLTTYNKLAELNREGICFITLRRVLNRFGDGGQDMTVAAGSSPWTGKLRRG
ncbi:MAG TPA: hypothetical protein VGF03_15245, partial [Bryobacteraceae bacterium]